MPALASDFIQPRRVRVSLTTLVEARLTFLHSIRTVERSHLAAPGALIFPITRDLLIHHEFVVRRGARIGAPGALLAIVPTI